MGGVVVDAPRISPPQAARPWWAGTRVDAVLAGAMAVVSVGLALAIPPEPPYEPLDAVTLAAAAAGPLALVWRQTAPLVAQAGAGLAIVATSAAGSPIDFLAWPAWFALFSCFAVGERRLRAAAAAIAALAVAGYVAFDRAIPWRRCPRSSSASSSRRSPVP